MRSSERGVATADCAGGGGGREGANGQGGDGGRLVRVLDRAQLVRDGEGRQQWSALVPECLGEGLEIGGLHLAEDAVDKVLQCNLHAPVVARDRRQVALP